MRLLPQFWENATAVNDLLPHRVADLLSFLDCRVFRRHWLWDLRFGRGTLTLLGPSAFRGWGLRTFRDWGLGIDDIVGTGASRSFQCWQAWHVFLHKKQTQNETTKIHIYIYPHKEFNRHKRMRIFAFDNKVGRWVGMPSTEKSRSPALFSSLSLSFIALASESSTLRLSATMVDSLWMCVSSEVCVWPHHTAYKKAASHVGASGFLKKPLPSPSLVLV